MRMIRAALGTMACVVLAACATSSAPSKQELIIGAWQAEFEGQGMTLVYGPEQVTIREFGMSFPYEWLDADRIQLNAMGQQVVSSVEFDGSDIMHQTSDGVTQRMVRVP